MSFTRSSPHGQRLDILVNASARKLGPMLLIGFALAGTGCSGSNETAKSDTANESRSGVRSNSKPDSPGLGYQAKAQRRDEDRKKLELQREQEERQRWERAKLQEEAKQKQQEAREQLERQKTPTYPVEVALASWSNGTREWEAVCTEEFIDFQRRCIGSGRTTIPSNISDYQIRFSQKAVKGENYTVTAFVKSNLAGQARQDSISFEVTKVGDRWQIKWTTFFEKN